MLSPLDQNEAHVALLNKRRPVLFAGENHLITLYRPGSDAAMVWTSCWHCTYSADGEGTVLVMRVDQETTNRHDLPPLAIYTDNPSLGRMITERFNQYFDGFRNLGLAALALQSAQFVQYPNGRQSRRIVCTSGMQVIELIWEDIFDAAMELFYNTSGPIAYDVSAVICRAPEGSSWSMACRSLAKPGFQPAIQPAQLFWLSPKPGLECRTRPQRIRVSAETIGG